MKLTFTIDYRTHWGENISVEIESERIGRGKSITLLPLNTENGETWTGQFTIPARDMKQFLYRYVVVKEGQVIRREWDTVPRNFPANDSMSYIFPDYWRDIPALSHLYSSAYIRSMSPFNPRPTSFVYYRRTIVFRVQAPQLGTGQVLALVGNQAVLGN
ncbi:MAG: 4-alpha-glucanotransferase, partial [Paraprevotella sp.]|nr:4-alpha-glucanotransferase [Paraprevotella sp.]